MEKGLGELAQGRRAWSASDRDVVYTIGDAGSTRPGECRHKYKPLRAAFKFGRSVHFALRRKMRKPPISRVPAILNGLTNRPS